jgi:hypothetical protein
MAKVLTSASNDTYRMMIKGRTMAKTWKILFQLLIILSLTFVATARVKAQQQYPGITSEILPSEGGANTTIILRFTSNTTAGVGSVNPTDIFWDNNTIALNQAGTLGADGSFNYNITVPNESPLSNVGNHTIRVDSTVVPYGSVSFSFLFNVTQFVPSPEYLVLNDTYYSLLTNYTDVLGNYTQLLSSFAILSANYTTLLAEHNNDTLNLNTLISQRNVLNADFNSLSTNYILLSNSFGNLTNIYGSLSSNYAALQTNFQTLGSNYSTLSQDYSLLNSSYTGLISNYNGLVGQLDFSRNLNIALIIITIALAIITVYYVMIKPKRPTKLR